MKLMKIIAAVLLSSVLASAVHAQTIMETTNVAPTKIETLESQTNAIIVRGIGTASTLSAGPGMLTFQLKESFNADTGAILHGLLLDYAMGSFHRRIVIDYDEITPLLKAMDYIQTVNHDVTQLPNFEVEFRTKSGFQVICIGNQRQTAVQMFMKFGDDDRILVNSTQMSQLRVMVAQCQVALDALREAK